MPVLSLTEWAAVAAIVGPIITFSGLCLILVQIRGSRRATEAHAKAQIYGLGLRLHEMMIRHPEIREYLYDDAPPPELGELRARTLLACEMYCDFFEYVIAEGSVVGADVRQAWISMMRTMVRRSPSLRIFVADRRDQYTSAFLEVFDAEKSR